MLFTLSFFNKKPVCQFLKMKIRTKTKHFLQVQGCKVASYTTLPQTHFPPRGSPTTSEATAVPVLLGQLRARNQVSSAVCNTC